MAEAYRKALVTLDGIENPIHCYLTVEPTNWNGFVIPYFDVDAVYAIKESLSNNDEILFEFIDDNRIYIVDLEGTATNADVIFSQTITVDGKLIEVWCFGGCSWGWWTEVGDERLIGPRVKVKYPQCSKSVPELHIPNQAPDLLRYAHLQLLPCKIIRGDFENQSDLNEPDVESITDFEHMDEAEFWTIYGHITGRGHEVLANFKSLWIAEAVVTQWAIQYGLKVISPMHELKITTPLMVDIVVEIRKGGLQTVYVQPENEIQVNVDLLDHDAFESFNLDDSQEKEEYEVFCKLRDSVQTMEAVW